MTATSAGLEPLLVVWMAGGPAAGCCKFLRGGRGSIAVFCVAAAGAAPLVATLTRSQTDQQPTDVAVAAAAAGAAAPPATTGAVSRSVR